MVIFSEILDRLKIITGKTKDKEIAEEMGVKEPTLNRWKARNTIPCEEIVLFANKHNVNLNYLILGKGEIYNSNTAITQSGTNINTIGNGNKAKIKITQSSDSEMQEIMQDLCQLPDNKRKKIYHLIKAELTEL